MTDDSEHTEAPEAAAAAETQATPDAPVSDGAVHEEVSSIAETPLPEPASIGSELDVALAALPEGSFIEKITGNRFSVKVGGMHGRTGAGATVLDAIQDAKGAVRAEWDKD